MARTPVATEGRKLESCGVVLLLDPFRVKPFDGQIRSQFFGIDQLAGSIEAVGQAMPIKVRLLDDDPSFDAELVDGERRLRACRQLKKPIKAVVDDEVDTSNTQFAHCVAANFGRQDHNPIEILRAIVRFTDQGMPQSRIAALFGRSPGWVSQYFSLQKLDPSVQELLIPPNEESFGGADDSCSHGDKKSRPVLAFAVAIVLVKLSHAKQREAAEKIVGSGMSMTAARRYVLQLLRDAGHAPRIGSHRKEAFQGLEKSANSMCDRFGVFLDMDNNTLQNMLRGMSPLNLGAIAEVLDKLAESSSQMSCVINSHLKKNKPKKG